MITVITLNKMAVSIILSSGIIPEPTVSAAVFKQPPSDVPSLNYISTDLY